MKHDPIADAVEKLVEARVEPLRQEVANLRALLQPCSSSDALTPQQVRKLRRCRLAKVWRAMDDGRLPFVVQPGRGGKPCRLIKRADAVRWQP